MKALSPHRWAVVAGLLSAVVVALVLADVTSPVRGALVLAYLLLVPGAAVVRLFGFDEVAVQISLGSALSVCIAGIVSGFLLYAHAWSPAAALAVIVAITLGAVTIEVARIDRRQARYRLISEALAEAAARVDTATKQLRRALALTRSNGSGS